MIEVTGNETRESAFDELIGDEYSRQLTCLAPPVA
jgi:hypothetical protein